MAQKNDLEKYRDMLELPHPDPKTRSRMPEHSRAAQFASFDALTGFDDVVSEAIRET